MDHATKNEQLEMETVRFVLEEFAEEQKLSNQNITDLITSVNGVAKKLEEIKMELDKPRSTPQSINIQPLQEMIRNGFTDVLHKLIERPAPVTVKKLPTLPTRWYMLAVVVFFLFFLCRWCMHYSDNQKEIQMTQAQEERVKMENNQTRKAWDYMYKNNGKDIKRLMKSAYMKAGK